MGYHVLKLAYHTHPCRRVGCGTILDITSDGKSKGWEIDEWLMECESQVNRYAIIDDENDMQTKQQKHFVQTNSQFGITCKDAERVITILRLILINK